MNKWKSKSTAHLNSAQPKKEGDTKSASPDAAPRSKAAEKKKQTPTPAPATPPSPNPEPASSDSVPTSSQDELHPARIWPD